MHTSAPAAGTDQRIPAPSPGVLGPPLVAAALTLGELLAGDMLKLLAGGPGSHARVVGDAHVLEGTGRAQLDVLEPGTLAVASRVAAGPSAPDLVAELSERDVCALAVADGRVPRAAVEEALRLGFPLLAARAGTSCDALLHYVDATRAQTTLDVLQRSLSGQEYLMEALREARPVDALVRRLAWLLAGEAVLYNDGGHVIAATGTARTQELWKQIADHEAAPQHFDMGACHVTSMPVVIDGRVRYWLAAMTRRDGDEPASALLRVVERLLELVTLARAVAAEDEHALRAGLLTGALEERDPRRLQEIAQRAQRFGITYAVPSRVVVAAPRAPGRWTGAPAAPSPAERLRRLLAAGRTPYLLDEQSGRLVALVQGECAEVEAWVATLEREGVDVVAGIGRPHDALHDAQESLHDAQLAVEQLPAGRGGAVVRSEETDLARWILGGIAPERLGPRVAALLADIKADERLYETLVAYLDADLDLRRTAAALHLHVNSVRYRLGKIEALLGRPVQRVATLADLYLAVTVDRAGATHARRAAR